MPTLYASAIVVGGTFVLLILVFQMLVGYRKIKLKGPKHLKVHRATAWVLTAAALFHGIAAVTYLGVFG